MNIDTTINIWNILMVFFGAVVWIVTIAVAWTKFGGRMDMIEFRVGLMEDTLIKIGAVLEKFNTNEADVLLLKREFVSLQSDHSELHKTVEDLRRGNGWIQHPMREGINGEYSRG